MRRLTLVLVAILALSFVAVAQDFPMAEVNVRYSYMRIQTGAPTSFGAANSSGVGGGLNFNVNKNVGLFFDFAHQFSTKKGTDYKMTSFLGGPQFTYRGEQRLSPFARFYIGAMHAGDGFVVGTPSNSGSAIPAETKWAFGFGGGVDAKFKSNLSIRVAQVDYLRSHFGNYHQSHFRLGFGIVFRVGEKSK